MMAGALVRFKGNVNDLIDLFEEVARELRSMEKGNGVN